jgi:alpha-beta hydrolase superfamily lysophospholipase
MNPSRNKIFALPVLIAVVAIVSAALLAVAFGGPNELPPMASISNPFRNVDYSDLPAASRFAARDGTNLAYRAYPAAGAAKGSVVLVHGSAAGGDSMHVMAKAFAAAGYTAYALDIRGHGGSGNKGQIDYIGQLENDLEDFCRAVKPAQPATLAGFSAGGGFVLRFAGSSRQNLFADYLLLSPFISRFAPTYRANAGGWVSVGVPRMIAIGLFNAAGVRVFNELPVTNFAVNDYGRKSLTSQYSYALAKNFAPERDYQANIRAANRPLRLVAGQDDEVFYTDRFAAVFQAEGKDVHVTLVPGIGHIPLTLESAAVRAAVSAVTDMHEDLREDIRGSGAAPGLERRSEERPILIEILRHTPSWVFVLFFALLALGYSQSRVRTLSRSRVAILPAAMAVFSCYGVISAFGVGPVGLACWEAGMAAAAALGVALGGPKGVVYSPATLSFSIPGSWLPLGLMMAIFFTKFAVGVTLARALPVAGEPVFVDAVSLGYGFFSGIFLARALVIWRAQMSPPADTPGLMAGYR